MKALPDSFASRAGATRPSLSCAPAETQRRAAEAQPAVAMRFPKSSKLLRHADFQRVYKQGRRHFAAHMTVFYLRRGDVPREHVSGGDAAPPHDVARPRSAGAGPRVGLTVGRVLGGAVQRNRIKRRLREAVRHNLGSLAVSVDVVINPKKSALMTEFQLLKDEVARAFQVISETESRRH